VRLRILELSGRVREWAEEASKRDVKFGRDLHGMCAIANAHLYRVLKDHGIATKIAVNDEHVHLRRGGMILDITATQFGDFDKVLYATEHKIQSTGYGHVFVPDVLCESLEDLNAALRGWPSYQLPTNAWDPAFIASFKLP
jgi:hypothetical protein